MSKKKFKWLVPEELPSPVQVKRRKEYDECVEEFLESGLKSARVNIPGVKPLSLARLLTGRIKRKGLTGKIRVSVRKDKVYLVRLDEREEI